MSLSAATASKSAAVPAGTYAWGALIARAQNRCDPAMLARHLCLADNIADQLFNDLIRNGVLRTPGVAGIAQAARPINATATPRRAPLDKLSQFMASEDQKDEAAPLVKDDSISLGCENTQPEDTPDASPHQHLQNIAQER